jgi:rSAM/selenodomain-associated transferase 1
MSNENLLIVFLKAPRASFVKTRIAKTLGPENASIIYRALADDLLANLIPEKGFEIIVMFWPPDGSKEIEQWLENKFKLQVQAEGNLGKKISSAFSDALNKNYKNVIIIGSDLPYLNAEDIHGAFNDLETTDLLLGPSSDGGYYLIGLKKPCPPLFEDINWSTPQVLPQTLSRAKKAGLSFKLLPEKRDIDNYEDLVFLENFIENTRNQRNLPNTHSTLKKLLKTNSFNFLLNL